METAGGDRNREGWIVAKLAYPSGRHSKLQMPMEDAGAVFSRVRRCRTPNGWKLRLRRNVTVASGKVFVIPASFGAPGSRSSQAQNERPAALRRQ